MSQVRLKNRRQSGRQFIDTARELLKHTLSYAKKFPKSLMFLITKDIADTARKVYTEVVKANSCFPTSQAAVDFRFQHFSEALGCLEALDGLLSVSLEMYEDHLLPKTETVVLDDGKTKEIKHGISDYGWVHWGELISQEENLIKGVMASDKKRTFE